METPTAPTVKFTEETPIGTHTNFGVLEKVEEGFAHFVKAVGPKCPVWVGRDSFSLVVILQPFIQ